MKSLKTFKIYLINKHIKQSNYISSEIITIIIIITFQRVKNVEILKTSNIYISVSLQIKGKITMLYKIKHMKPKLQLYINGYNTWKNGNLSLFF